VVAEQWENYFLEIAGEEVKIDVEEVDAEEDGLAG
jgi:hypothetical protein